MTLDEDDVELVCTNSACERQGLGRFYKAPARRTARTRKP
jgi:hypothetical protein